MSYLVLARKCRPQNFDEVAAQEHITDTLKKAIEKDRLSHSYLFCGPRGTGKTTMARILAKALNCQSFDAPTATPCGVCESCVAIASSRSGDVLEIDGASNRGVQEIQALRERVQYAPQGRFKVFIIDEVHMLTKEAFNALLKTLEEPPPRVVFIFATTEPQKIPPTIISRCQRYDFRRIPTDVIARRIMKIADAEGLKLSEDAAAIVAQRADGGLRDSLSLLDQVLAYSPRGELSADEVARILGILPLDAFVKISERIADRDPAGTIEELDLLLETGIDISQIAAGLSEHFHGALTAAIGLKREGVSERAIEEYSKLSREIATEDILRMAKLASELQGKLKSSSMPRFIFEEALIYMASLDRAVDIGEALAAVREPQRAKAQPIQPNRDNKPVQASPRQFEPVAGIPSRPPEPIAVEQDEPPKNLDPNFNRFIELFAASRGEGKAEMLQKAQSILDEERIILKFPLGLKYQVETILNRKDNFDALHEAAEAVYGAGTRVKLVVEDGDIREEEPQKPPPSRIPDEVARVLFNFDAKLEN